MEAAKKYKRALLDEERRGRGSEKVDTTKKKKPRKLSRFFSAIVSILPGRKGSKVVVSAAQRYFPHLFARI
jgi:hypothetical protein